MHSGVDSGVDLGMDLGMDLGVDLGVDSGVAPGGKGVFRGSPPKNSKKKTKSPPEGRGVSGGLPLRKIVEWILGVDLGMQLGVYYSQAFHYWEVPRPST